MEPEAPEAHRQLSAHAVHEVQIRRCQAVDLKDWAVHETLHAPDFRSWHSDSGRWGEEGARAYTERVKAMSEGRRSIHYVNSPVLTFETPDKVSGVWTMHDRIWWDQDGEEHWLKGFGFYRDTLERRGGIWLFTSRKLERRKVMLSEGAAIG